jgi:primosomal protein N' (replication factor Y)
VSLVGVVSADTSLHMPDFRASERTFQLVAQVAGRCGRGDRAGVVIVQTFNSNDAAITAAARHDYEAFAARELQHRARSQLPPITRMSRIVVRDRDPVACFARAQELGVALREAVETLGVVVRVRGPSPCPIARIAEHHRQELQLLASGPGALLGVMTRVRNAGLLKSDHRTAVDVDPVALM